MKCLKIKETKHEQKCPRFCLRVIKFCTVKNNKRIYVFFIAEEWSGEIANKEPYKCNDLAF